MNQLCRYQIPYPVYRGHQILTSPHAPNSHLATQQQLLHQNVHQSRRKMTFKALKNKTSDPHFAIERPRPDVIIGTETWLTKNMSSSEFILVEFEVFRWDREDEPHGGVLVATRRTIVSSVALVGKSSEFLRIKVKLNHDKSVIIAVAYRPPNRRDDDYTRHWSKTSALPEIKTSHHASCWEEISTYQTLTGDPEELLVDKYQSGLTRHLLTCRATLHWNKWSIFRPEAIILSTSSSHHILPLLTNAKPCQL